MNYERRKGDVGQGSLHTQNPKVSIQRSKREMEVGAEIKKFLMETTLP